MTFRSPSGSSVYLILALIQSFASPPVAGSKYSNDMSAICESHGQDTFVDDTETVVPLLAYAVRKILGDDTLRISEGELCSGERHAVFLLVLSVLLRVPIEVCPSHSRNGIKETSMKPYDRMGFADS